MAPFDLPIPDAACDAMFSGSPSPASTDLLERVLLAGTGAVVLTAAEQRAGQRWIALTDASHRVEVLLDDLGRDTIADRILCSDDHQVVLAVLWRERNAGPHGYGASIAHLHAGRLHLTPCFHDQRVDTAWPAWRRIDLRDHEPR